MSDPVILAYLGWANSDRDTASMRLYVTDSPPEGGNGDRWDTRYPGGHVAEYAAIERDGGEGDKYLVVRVGDRFTPDELAHDVAAAVRAALGWGGLDVEACRAAVEAFGCPCHHADPCPQMRSAKA
jgi:hypothetical protein